ncbi:MAG: lambda exonuclease family protein [Georgfuchsia sp.]
MTEQGSAQWLAERCGKVTASRIADLMATTKSGPSASRANYLAQLVAERLTGTVQESYSNGAMQWGTETEPMARARYEVRYGVMVDQIGFVPHPTISMSGASPDGLISDDGLIEIKCPNTATHIDTLLTGKVPSKYLLQMYWQMACTGRKWCDFVSFDPRMPDDLSMFVSRVERDDARIEEITFAVSAFLADVEMTIGKLNALIDHINAAMRSALSRPA